GLKTLGLTEGLQLIRDLFNLVFITALIIFDVHLPSYQAAKNLEVYGKTSKKNEYLQLIAQ
ncbi:MAG TPA: hypothetical protein DCF68_18765, partial [Cyanothece sp. UBA12306]|nr:hypothetical protein [Cyanothece sp. UBA12306]